MLNLSRGDHGSTTGSPIDASFRLCLADRHMKIKLLAAISGELRGRAIWNQFLRRNWQIHQETTSLFLKRVGELERAEDYLRCFPYPPLSTEAPIQEFYTFYEIEER